MRNQQIHSPKIISVSFSQLLTITNRFNKKPHHYIYPVTPSLEHGIYRQAHLSDLSNNWCYRLIFFSFGLLFLGFAAAIFFKTVNFNCSEYFKHCFLVKHCVNAFCLFLAGGAFTAGYYIKPQRDGLSLLADRVQSSAQHNHAGSWVYLPESQGESTIVSS